MVRSSAAKRREGKSLAESHSASTSRETNSLREIIEGFLFYVGIPALTLYPLGFVALCLQMWRRRS
jgi:hypothetical protein